MEGPPPPYETAMMQPTPVAQERRSTNTAIGESERPRPRMPPVAQNNAPMKEQPDHTEFRYPLDHIQNEPSRKPSNQTLSDSNAAHLRPAQLASPPTTSIESERPRPRTPPMAQSNAPIKDQPVRIDYRHPLDHIKDDSSRNPSNQALSGSNAERTHPARSAPAPQEQSPGAEETPPTRAGIESERPRVPPVAQSSTPIKEQPARTDYRHPLDRTQDDPSRKPSYQTPSDSNAAHTRAAQSAQASQGQGGGSQLAQARSKTSEQANQKPKKKFICC